MVKKDFITSIVLIAFSISVVVSSYTMPRLERRGIDPFSAPGVVPGMIGVILLCLSLILFVRSLRKGGYRLFSRAEAAEQAKRHPGAAGRVLLTLAISLIYSVGCLGRFDYSIITILYVFSFICLFEYRPEQPISGQKKMFSLALLQAVIASLLITVVFRHLFLVDLP
jgi:hypothetical protein